MTINLEVNVQILFTFQPTEQAWKLFQPISHLVSLELVRDLRESHKLQAPDSIDSIAFHCLEKNERKRSLDSYESPLSIHCANPFPFFASFGYYSREDSLVR